MPFLEIYCGALDISLNALKPVFEHLTRPTEADVIPSTAFDFVSTMYIPTEVMQNLFYYNITSQNEQGIFTIDPYVSYYTRTLEFSFDNAPVRFNPMCGDVISALSTTKFDNACDYLVTGTDHTACDQDCNNVDWNIVPYVLLRYLALAVMNDADAWRVFTNVGDSSWNTITDIVPKLISDTQNVCFGQQGSGTISSAFIAENARTVIDALTNTVDTNENNWGSKTMADLVYRTMIAADNTRFHVEDPAALFNPMPFQAGDCLSFLFTIGMGEITNIGDMAVETVPNNLVIKVRLECAGPGINDPNATAYTAALHTSISHSSAAGIYENIREAQAVDITAKHTDFYINETLMPSIVGFDVPLPHAMVPVDEGC